MEWSRYRKPLKLHILQYLEDLFQLGCQRRRLRRLRLRRGAHRRHERPELARGECYHLRVDRMAFYITIILAVHHCSRGADPPVRVDRLPRDGALLLLGAGRRPEQADRAAQEGAGRHHQGQGGAAQGPTVHIRHRGIEKYIIRANKRILFNLSAADKSPINGFGYQMGRGGLIRFDR